MKVTLELTLPEAEELRDSLADIICWCRGFNAARSPEWDGPISSSIDTLSNSNIKLKRAIDVAQGAAPVPTAIVEALEVIKANAAGKNWNLDKIIEAADFALRTARS